MKIINEDLFIKNYFNKKRYFVYNEVGAGILMLAMLGGMIIHFAIKKLKELEKKAIEAYLNGPDNEITDQSQIILKSLNEVIAQFEKRGEELSPVDKQKLKQLKIYAKELEDSFTKKLIPETKEKIKSNLINAGSSIDEMVESVVPKLDPKNNSTHQIILDLQNAVIKYNADLGADITQLKESLKNLVEKANLSDADKEKAQSMVSEIKDFKDTNKYSIIEFFENQKIKKANREEIDLENYFEILNKKKTLTLNFNIKYYSLSKEKYEQILKKLKDGFTINKKNTDVANLFEEEDAQINFEIGNKEEDSKPIKFTLYFSYEKNEDEIKLKPFSDTIKKFQEVIDPSSSIDNDENLKGNGADIRKEKYFFNIDEWGTDQASLKEGGGNGKWISLINATGSDPSFSIIKNNQKIYIKFVFQNKKFTKNQLINFKQKFDIGFAFKDEKKSDAENIDLNKLFLEHFLFEEDKEEELISIRDFSIEIKLSGEGNASIWKVIESDKNKLNKIIPTGTSDATLNSENFPEKLYYDLEKPLVIGSELLTSHMSQDAYVVFKKKKGTKYFIEKMEAPEGKKIDQVLVKTVLTFESILPINPDGEIDVIIKNNKYYIKEIIKQSSLEKTQNLKDTIKNFFNGPEDKFSDIAKNIPPLFAIGFQRKNSNTITILKTVGASSGDGTYWFILRGNVDRAKKEYVVGTSLGDINKNKLLISFIKRIAFIMLKYDTNINNFKKFLINPVEGNNGLFFDPIELNNIKIREKYLTDFTLLTKIFKNILKDDYDKIKTTQMYRASNFKGNKQFSFVKFLPFNGTWTSYTAPKNVTPEEVK